MPPTHVLLIIVAIAGLLVVAIVASVVGARKRTEALARRAVELGLSFAPDALGFTENAPRLKVLERGHSKKARNLLSGRHGGFDVTVVDYRYVTGGGKHSHTHNQTLCLVRGSGATLPRSFVRREIPFLDAIGQKLGGQDIDFPEDEAFSKAFVLQGEDPEATRNLFGAAVRAHFLQLPRGPVEVELDSQTLCLHHGRLVKPEELRDLLERAERTLAVLRDTRW